MPTALRCSQCGGVVIPRKDVEGRKLDWTIYTFGDEVLAAERFPDTVFPGSLEDFDSRIGIAICVAHKGAKYLLARHPQSDADPKRLPPEYSVQTASAKVVYTSRWNDISPEDHMRFRSCLDEGMSSFFLNPYVVSLLTSRAGHPDSGYWRNYVALALALVCLVAVDVGIIKCVARWCC